MASLVSRTLVALVLLGIMNDVSAQQEQTAGVSATVAAVGFDCTNDMCSTVGGCASCVQLKVTLPANAWVDTTHCKTTAEVRQDVPIHEIPCGADFAWSRFEVPLVTPTVKAVFVTAVYRNRSSNRARTVELQVNWHAVKQPVLPYKNFDQRVQEPSKQVGPTREIVDNVVWSIAHEGCRVFKDNHMQSVSALKACYSLHARSPHGADLVKSASPENILEATRLGIERASDEYQVRANFNWVMDHEGQSATFAQLAGSSDYEAIRQIYAQRQAHNDMAMFALSGLKDSDVQLLVERRPLPQEGVTPPEVPEKLVSFAERAMLSGRCRAFTGEQAQAASYLKECYANASAHNRNGEAVETIQTSEEASLKLATQRAVARIKAENDIDRSFGLNVSTKGNEERIRSLAKDNQISAIREIYASAADTNGLPNYLNALADSEVAATAVRLWLNIVVPARASDEVIRSIVELTQPRLFSLANIDPSTITADKICASQSDARPICRTLTDEALKAHPIVKDALGRPSVQVPNIPPQGVPTLVSFRSNIPDQTLRTQLASRRVSAEEPRGAHLIMSRLATSGRANNAGNDGRSWYAKAISADKIEADDLDLHDTVRVAIIDAGVDTTHGMLKPFFWSLPIEFPNVRWKRDSIGWDYVLNGPNPQEDPVESESHGTHVTGLVTARGLVQWLPVLRALNLEKTIEVFSLKVAAGKNGDIPDFTMPLQALADGLPNQIHLFNLSLVGPWSQMSRDEVLVRHRQDALLVLAAGNNKVDLNLKENLHTNGTFRNDAGGPLDNAIFVASFAESGDLADDSNYGDRAVEIAAPGEDVWSTVQGGGFDSLSGTSQAAPLVTLTAALLLSEKQAFPTELKERILATCDWDTSLEKSNQVKEGCRLNMAKAVIRKTDIVEVYSDSQRKSSQWLRCTVDRASLRMVGADGKPLDSTNVQRIQVNDAKGTAKIAIKNQGHLMGTLLSQLTVTPQKGGACPTRGSPCRIDIALLKDIAFRW